MATPYISIEKQGAGIINLVPGSIRYGTTTAGAEALAWPRILAARNMPK